MFEFTVYLKVTMIPIWQETNTLLGKELFKVKSKGCTTIKKVRKNYLISAVFRCKGRCMVNAV